MKCYRNDDFQIFSQADLEKYRVNVRRQIGVETQKAKTQYYDDCFFGFKFRTETTDS